MGRRAPAGLTSALLPHPARGLLGLVRDIRRGRLGLAGHGGSRVRGRLLDRFGALLRRFLELLGRLLAGIHAPGAGSVTVGGVSLTELAPDELRSSVAVLAARLAAAARS